MPSNDTPISIFSPQVIESMRDNGFKSTASALAELIDNSIEAGADKIRVITFEKKSGSKQKFVDSIAIYDNGSGMSPEIMECALQFGGGTKHKSVSGMGRFGMGLPNSSVSVCRKVTLYSWMNNKCFSSTLDIEEIVSTNNLILAKPVKCEIPKAVIKELEEEVGESGTIVIWEDCDRLDFKMAKTLFNRMEGDLCRIFRHFLDEDNDYGHQVEIKLIKPRGYQYVRDERILVANDPLYILTPNNCPGYGGKAINELQNETTHEREFSTAKGKGIVEVRVTVTKPEIHREESGKSGPLMNHLRKNQGVSFVRYCREIQLGNFGYVNNSDPRERWWGVEVRFPPVLDELFGVTNNKQTVKQMNKLGQEDIDDIMKDYGIKSIHDDYLNTSDGQAAHLKIWLSQVIGDSINKARTTINVTNKGKRTISKSLEFDKASKAATEILEKKNAKPLFDKEASAKSEEQARNELKERLLKHHRGAGEAELNELVNQVEKYKIHIEVDSWSGEQFFDIELYGATPVVKLNSRHPFYESIYRDIEENHPETLNAVKVLIMSYALSEKEFFGDAETKLIDRVRSKWGYYTSEILDQLQASK
ncbi:MAG: ATP-binding protein [Coraliomargaritaceae bacterium]